MADASHTPFSCGVFALLNGCAPKMACTMLAALFVWRADEGEINGNVSVGKEDAHRDVGKRTHRNTEYHPTNQPAKVTNWSTSQTKKSNENTRSHTLTHIRTPSLSSFSSQSHTHTHTARIQNAPCLCDCFATVPIKDGKERGVGEIRDIRHVRVRILSCAQTTTNVQMRPLGSTQRKNNQKADQREADEKASDILKEAITPSIPFTCACVHACAVVSACRAYLHVNAPSLHGAQAVRGIGTNAVGV